MADWILLPLLCTPEAAVLRQWADMEPEQPALSDGGWQVRLWESPVFECGSAAAAPEEAAVQEQRYDLSAMELRYGRTAACTIPTHYDMVQGNTVDPLRFAAALRQLDPAACFALPALGERLLFQADAGRKNSSVFSCPPPSSSIQR